MSQTPHYSQFLDLTEALLAFTQLAREGGLNVGIEEMLQAKKAALAGMIQQPDTYYYSLKSLYCTKEDDRKVFDVLFYMFWKDDTGRANEEQEAAPKARDRSKNKGSIMILGKGQAFEGEEESENTTGANAQERLQQTDFSTVSAIDGEMLEELAEKLLRQMSQRLKRKMKSNPRKGAIDVRKTIRQNISRGGEPLVLARKNRKPRKQRLILILDVSGSMDKYSFFLLRFICILQSHFEFVEAFIFSTKLIRITDYIQSVNLKENLRSLSQEADNWSSGTQIGECLKAFNEEFAKKLLNGSSTVIVLSDGLDTGEPHLLAQEIRKIRLRTRQLIWLNPLKGNPNFQPIQRGMKAALPEVDVFRSAHNLKSLLELEDFLAGVF